MPEPTGAQQTRLTVLLLRRNRWDNVSLLHYAFLGFVSINLEFESLCFESDFAHKPDPGSYVFLVDILLHRWIIHMEHVAYNTTCSSSSALHLLVITRRRIWTLVFHIPVVASTKPPNPSLASLLRTCYEHWNTHSSRQRAQGQGRHLDSPAPRFRFSLPHLIQSLQNLTNSPDDTLLITLS